MIIFMGVAGSGKSLQGKLLADQMALPWLSTGEFLRMLIAGEHRTEMLGGKLLDDAEIICLVQKIFVIVDVSAEFVMDGFPRTIEQADWLLSQVKHGQLHVSAVIHLRASDQAVRSRLLQRGRQDDHDAAIAERFKEYEDSIRPILSYFSDAKVPVHDIDGEGEINVVHARIVEALKSQHVL